MSLEMTSLADARRSLLEKYLLSGNVLPATPSRVIEAKPGAEPCLSFSQERLWFLDQLMPGSPVFNVPVAVRLSCAVDETLLEKSINEIVRRHESLRTTFTTENGRPVPQVSRESKFTLRIQDIRQHPQANEIARAAVNNEAETPFDLESGPLIRALLIRITEAESIFVLTLHHICSDGWSLILFFEELTALYQTYSEGGSSGLPELSIQYADYAAWQRTWLTGDVLNKQLAYWKEKLGGELPILDLPSDRSRPSVQTYAGNSIRLSVGAETTSALNVLSQRHGATLFMTLLAAFKLLLYRHTGQTDIIVGSPIANRPQTDTEKLIGFFLNNLALRTDLSGNPSFKELLGRVRSTALDAYANQDVPFEKLIEELRPERDLSRTTIFQVYFNLFSFADEMKLPGQGNRTTSFFKAWSELDESLSKFDLTLYAGVDHDELQLAMVYNTDLFESQSIHEMLEQYRVLLHEIVANPDVSISSCPLVRGKRAIAPTNDFIEFPQTCIEQTITQRFTEQAKLHGKKLAVKTSNFAWTYDELNLIAERIAQAVRSHPSLTAAQKSGQTPVSTIALLFDHDAPMVGAMLGALKAGTAYVPLDPLYPAARLAQIIKDSEANLILTTSGYIKTAARLSKNVIDVNKLPRTPVVDVNVGTTPDALAYLLYTSGSTGQPKGVMQNHRNVLHFIRAYTNNLHINADDRLTLFSSYCFDASVMDIYGALLNGATLYPVDIKKQGFDGMIDCLRNNEITIYHSTPTVYRRFIESIGDEMLSLLRLIVLGGEAVKTTDVDAYKRHFSDDCLMVNGLGPTEATVSLQYFIDKQTHISGQSVPVGHAVTGTNVLLLDDAVESTGVSGEIALKCEHVALGYWRNETATATAFMRDADGSRIYRTGDLGRKLPDGSVLFTGRKDSQVKIRGFRVELNEIEAVLTRHASVRECVVVLTSNSDDDKALTAYIVPHATKAIDSSALRRHVADALPEYMVPAYFVSLEAIPLTASGKINRRALPRPSRLEARHSNSQQPIHGAVETLLAAIWAEVLGLKTVGPDDNFFELGGHSLLAVVLFARIAKYFGKRLPLATLFRAPTVTTLAAVIKDCGSTAWSSLVPIQPFGSRPPFFCVHAKGGNVLEYHDLAQHLGMDQPFYGLQSRGLNQESTPHTRVVDMAAHYLEHIRDVQPHGPYLLGGRSFGGTIAYEMACQLRAAGEEVALLALLDTFPAGYLKLLPEAGTLRSKLWRLRRRVKSHYFNMSGSNLKERCQYILEKARFGPPRIKTMAWRTVFRIFEYLNKPLPRVLRDVKEFNSLAGAQYGPAPYPGVVTLFWASGDRRASYDFLDGWRVLAPEGIEIHEISGSHLNLIKEPYVTELAQKLGQCLESAAATIKKSAPASIMDQPIRKAS